MQSVPTISSSGLPARPHPRVAQLKNLIVPTLSASASQQSGRSEVSFESFQTAFSSLPYCESPINIKNEGFHNLTGQEPIIAVMGPTGVGKSTFIKLATGSDDVRIGDSLESCTRQSQVIRCHNPLQNCDVLFIDTPGFDDTVRTDMDILQGLADWLEKTYRCGVKLSGILYLHRITDNRMTNTLIRNLDLFRNLCGDDALSNIRFVTTNWDLLPDKNEGKRIERELIDGYWKPFIKNKSQVHRFQYSCASAWEIVNSLPMERKTVQLQKELVDQNKPLSRTAAGQSLLSWAGKALQELIGRLELLIRKITSSSYSSSFSHDQLDARRKELRDAKEDLRIIKSQEVHPQRTSWSRRRSPTNSLRSSNESTFSGESHSSLTSWRIVTQKVFEQSESSLRRRVSRVRSPGRKRMDTSTFGSVQIIPASPQNSVCDIPDTDSLYEVATGADIVATGTLTGTIQTLKFAQASVVGLPIPGLAATISAGLRIAELLKEMRDTDRSLIILINNVGRFVKTICNEDRPAQAYPPPVINAVGEFSRQLKKIEQVALNIKRRSRRSRCALDPDDRRVIIDCNDAIKLALQSLGIRIGLATIAQNENMMEKLNHLESLVTRMLSQREEFENRRGTA